MSKKIKVLLLGNTKVGKTSLASYLINKYCHQDYARTIGMDLRTTYININKQVIQLQIWDAAGHERYKHIVEIYYKNIDFVILVYSVIDTQSFLDLEMWIDELQKKNPDVINNLVIIGNKSDLTQLREVSYDKGKELAIKYKAAFFETNCKDGLNVELCFKSAAEKYYPNIIETDSEDNIEFSIFDESIDINCFTSFFNFIKTKIFNI